MGQRRRIIVGVTGTTGVEMSYELLLALRKAGCEIHLIVSHSAQTRWDYESRIPLQRMYDLADFAYKEDELDAVISSGSFVTDGMILMPCSMKTLAGIVAGYAETLILRAADVCLKEGRKVVLVPREMPLGKIHLRNMKEAADCGCAIVPPMLTFYNGAETVREQVRHVVGKVLLQFGVDYDKFVPWKNEKKREDAKNRAGGTEVRRKTEGARAMWDYSVENERDRHQISTVSEKRSGRVPTSDCTERQTAAVRRRFTHQLSFTQIEIQAIRVGCDIQLLLQGGRSQHIGCMVLATPCPSMTGDGSRSATASVINVTVHKDEALCRYLAEKVAAAANVVVACTGGFHIDGMTPEQIQEVQAAVKHMAREVQAWATGT